MGENFQVNCRAQHARAAKGKGVEYNLFRADFVPLFVFH
jgi:hypothetical protein